MNEVNSADLDDVDVSQAADEQGEQAVVQEVERGAHGGALLVVLVRLLDNWTRPWQAPVEVEWLNAGILACLIAFGVGSYVLELNYVLVTRRPGPEEP